MTTNKISVLKIASLVPGIFLIVLCFIFANVTLSEGYNMFNPFADTKFAKDYAPEKFKMIKECKHMRDVFYITGEPLNIRYDTTRALFIHEYTRDGYLSERKGGLQLCSDLAWYGSDIIYSKDSIIINVHTGWRYD